MEDQRQIAKSILDICVRLHNRNMLAAADGNVSYRLADGNILITPSGVSKAFMSSNDMAIVSLSGEVLKGKPSSESIMHLEVYKKNSKAKAVVHAHPPTAIAWSLAYPEDKFLPDNLLSELILAVGKIPIANFAMPGTSQMAEHLESLIGGYRTVILARHGAISWGEDLEEAYRGMERVEHICQILKSAVDLKGDRNLKPLDQETVDMLYQKRSEMGENTF